MTELTPELKQHQYELGLHDARTAYATWEADGRFARARALAVRRPINPYQEGYRDGLRESMAEADAVRQERSVLCHLPGCNVEIMTSGPSKCAGCGERFCGHHLRPSFAKAEQRMLYYCPTCAEREDLRAGREFLER